MSEPTQLDLVGLPTLAEQLAGETSPTVRSLLEIQDLLERSKVEDFAWAESLEGLDRLAAYKRIRDAACDAWQDAAEVKLRAERALGRLLSERPRTKADR